MPLCTSANILRACFIWGKIVTRDVNLSWKLIVYASAHSINSMPMFLFVLAIATLSGTSHAIQCGCATYNVNLHSGPGTDYDIIDTLRARDCLAFSGQEQVGEEYTWYQLLYSQDVWAASNWLVIQECPNGNVAQDSNVQLPGCPRIITRAEWGARNATHPIADMPDLPIYVFIHHGASSPCFDETTCKQKVRGYQNYHIDGHGWWDIGYNFVVGEDGNAYEARGWNEQGAHTKGYNKVGIAICIIGNFMERLPNEAALATVQGLIRCGLDNHKINPNYTLKGHRDVGNTLCPGDKLYERIHSWPHYVNGTGLYRHDQNLIG